MAAKCLLEYGQKIVFLGDSITEAADGYVRTFQSIAETLLPDMKLEYVNAGVGGNNIKNMLKRIGEDVIAHDPDWIAVSAGINDVWHGYNGIDIDQFRSNYDELVGRLAKQTVGKLALFTTTVIGEELDSETNQRLIDYNKHIRAVAKKRGHLLVDMNEAFHAAITRWHAVGTDLKFTSDGVHTNPTGAYLMAHTLAKSWGVL